jgi:hypothetical protein
MKKISIILCLSAFLGLAFSPVIISNEAKNEITYTDTTKAVKKSKTKSDCTKSCGHSCTKSAKTTKPKSNPKKK